MTSELLSRIERHLWPAGHSQRVWMIADGARNSRIRPLLRELHLDYHCLYSGRLPESLEAAAPYLVQLERGDRGAQSLLREAWGNSWGVFFGCNEDAETLRRHLRGFLVVRGPGGSRLVFRYYDPRVLRVYLPTCSPDELRTVYGPIQCFWIEDEDPHVVLDYRFDTHLKSAKWPLVVRHDSAKFLAGQVVS